jgi:hypothetical protein
MTANVRVAALPDDAATQPLGLGSRRQRGRSLSVGSTKSSQLSRQTSGCPIRLRSTRQCCAVTVWREPQAVALRADRLVALDCSAWNGASSTCSIRRFSTESDPNVDHSTNNRTISGERHQ